MSRQRKEHYNIAVAGTGYVGLSLAILLAQHNHVTAVDIVEEKVEQINRRQSPIQDKYIEKYLAEKKLDLTATLDGKMAYSTADFIIIAAPTNYDSEKNFFDTSAVEKVIELILMSTREREDKPLIIIKSTVPVGYTKSVRERYRADNIIFSPEFLRRCMIIFIRQELLLVNLLPIKKHVFLRSFYSKVPRRKILKLFLWALLRRRQ